jgi:hypothetical protein
MTELRIINYNLIINQLSIYILSVIHSIDHWPFILFLKKNLTKQINLTNLDNLCQQKHY